MKVNVIDSIMGSGKTSWALQHINESLTEKRFVYITPYLDEVKRVRESVGSRSFVEPTNQNSEGRKLRSLKEHVVAGRDICATHSLFKMADDELIELLTDAGYTLILDEVMDVIEQVNISAKDIQALTDSSLIEIHDDKRVFWMNDDYSEGRFFDIKLLANAGNLFYHRGKFFIWTFPPQVFSAFEEVIILTYLFDAQIQRYYYDLYGIKYDYQSVRKNGDRYELATYDRQNENRPSVAALIEVYAGHLNETGDRKTALSASWLRGAGVDTLAQLKKNLYNYFRRHCSAKGPEILWTTLKDVQTALQGKGYSKSFVACNLRATNTYADRWALAYVFNRFMSPIERAFFEDRGVRVNEDLLAVSDLLQWVWRSRIRNGQPIKLYLPSSRMRSLLDRWANNEI